MSFSESDSAKIKKQIVLRYPFTFYEEVSRQLIIFKTYRGNKKVFRALPIMDELIDYVTLDPITGTSSAGRDVSEKGKFESIEIPAELVSEFKDAYHGSEEEFDGILGMKHLAPGTSVQDDKATVIIRKPMRFLEAYGNHPPEWTALVAGFVYKVTSTSPAGFPVTETVPMVNVDDPDLDYLYTTEIPRAVWSLMFENYWAKLGPICTRIERIIAATLTAKGFSEGSTSMEISPVSETSEYSGEDPSDLS